jgi:hypothetical protein
MKTLSISKIGPQVFAAIPLTLTIQTPAARSQGSGPRDPGPARTCLQTERFTWGHDSLIMLRVSGPWRFRKKYREAVQFTAQV